MNGRVLNKNNLKQFFTHHYEVIRPFLAAYPVESDIVIDPFAGAGHLLRLFDDVKTFAIDIDPDVCPDLVADSFVGIPSTFSNPLVITNPPYSHRHVLQKQDPRLYELVIAAGYTDLYEYSIKRIMDQLGSVPMFALIPENFVASRTTKLRKELCHHIRAVQIHAGSTCDDTAQPTVMVYLVPETVECTDLWLDEEFKEKIIIDRDGFRPEFPDCDNYVDFGMKPGQSQECLDTSVLLQATDGGSFQNRIKLMRVYDRFDSRHFHNKISDRAYIQVVPRFLLSEEQIGVLISEFNRWVDDWRESTHGLGLTSFRGNVGGFRRKRLDFKLARLIINRVIADRIIPELDLRKYHQK